MINSVLFSFAKQLCRNLGGRAILRADLVGKSQTTFRDRRLLRLFSLLRCASLCLPRFHVPGHVAKTQILIRPHICHGYHGLYLLGKFCHVEKFQIFVKNLNNLWRFIETYAVFVLDLCGEKSVWRISVWVKNDKYEV